MVEIRENNTIAEMLLTLPKKTPVTVLLRNGHSYKGTIVAVGEHNLHLDLSPSFSDAFVRLEDITAVEVQLRSK